MGNDVRAREFAEKLNGGDGFLKKWLFRVFEKCGNCEYRLLCWKPVIDPRGEAVKVYNRVYYCGGERRPYSSPPKSDGKHAARLIKHCADCIQLEHCVHNVLMSGTFHGLMETTSVKPENHVATLKRCAACPHIESCYTGVLRDLGFGWSSKLKAVAAFSKCHFKPIKEISEGGKTQ